MRLNRKLHAPSIVLGFGAAIVGQQLFSFGGLATDAMRSIHSLAIPELGLVVGLSLALAASWVASPRSGGPRSKITGISSLAERTARRTRFSNWLDRLRSAGFEEMPLMNCEEWLVKNVGFAAIGDDRAVAKALNVQLTPWTGLGDELLARPHRVVLLALLALAGSQPMSKNVYQDFRDAINDAVHTLRIEGKLTSDNAPGVVRGFADRAVSVLADRTEARQWVETTTRVHGTSETVLMNALSQVRKNVHLPESDFSWLMDVDRPLALALNAVGRPSVLPEALGAFCCWQAELRGEGRDTAMDAGVRSIRNVLSHSLQR